MQTDFCKKLGVEAPIFAFTHCRDVVVEVSKAGGLGVFAENPEEFREKFSGSFTPTSSTRETDR